MFEKIFRPVLLLLLAVIIGLQISGMVIAQKNHEQCIKELAPIATELKSLQSGYQADVYNNAKVDSAAKQTVIATEYVFTMQQEIAAILMACK